MKFLAHIFLFSVCVFLISFVEKEKSKSTQVKPMKLKVYVQGDTLFPSGLYLPAQVEKLIDLPIVAKDSLNSIYKVLSFRLIYKELGVYENDQGETKIMIDVSSATMKDNKIDTLWTKTIHNKIAWGDTLIYDNIIVDVHGKRLFAPAYKLYMYNPKNHKPH